MTDPVARLSTAFAGRYVIERELGAGGMATVYLTADLKHRRKVAVKVLRPEFAAALGRDRFLREIEILGHLTHPHILPLHDSGVVDDVCFFVTPFLEGESLRARLDREGQLPIEDALNIAREVADALAYAHERGVIHRDVKPHNIMLESGHAVLADFGIALAVDAETQERLTGTGFSPGTPHYMSPEQGSAARRVDGRSDIYSLGCVLYEMLAGDPPFTGANLYAIMARHAAEPPGSLRLVRETVSESLENVCFRALAKSPADRFRTAEAFVQGLTEVAHERVRQTAPNGSRVEHVDRQIIYPSQTISGGRVLPDAGARRFSGRQIATGTALALSMLTAIGMLATAMFDSELQMPSQHRPSRWDFPIVGARALIPSVVYAFLAVLMCLVGARLLRLLTSTTSALRGHAIHQPEDTGSTTRQRKRVRGKFKPTAVADLFFVTTVAIGAVGVAAVFPLLVALFTSDTQFLGCDNRFALRLFQPSLTVVITGLAFAWTKVFAWVKREMGELGSVAIARWGSAAVMILLILVMTLPWRLMWAGGNERVLIGDERGYVLRETETQLVLYNADRGTTSIYASTDSTRFARLGVQGYVFEEPAMFRSGIQECESVTF